MAILATILILGKAAQAEGPVYFADNNLKQAIINALAVLEPPIITTDPTPNHMLRLTQLTADSYGIADLTGLEYGVSLQQLSLQGNQISNLSALSGLTNLGTLWLNSNQIGDLSALSGMGRLAWLYAENSQITSVTTLSGLTSLNRLDLGINQITDISALTGLTSLQELTLSGNPLYWHAYCVHLRTILANNAGVAIQVDPNPYNCSYEPTPTPAGSAVAINPLDNTTGTTPVAVTFEQVVQSGGTILASSSTGPATPVGYGLGNPPTYYNLTTTAGYTGLIDVCVSYAGISFAGPPESLRLMRYETGQWIDCTTVVNTGNQTICGVMSFLQPLAIMLEEEPVFIADANLKQAVKDALGLSTDPTPSDMIALRGLDAPSRGITNLIGLEYARNLGTLRLSANPISDVGPLANLTPLQYLQLDNNRITSVAPLSALTSLAELYLQQNQITEVSGLANLTYLWRLMLDRNQIADFSWLSNLPGLTLLSVEGNPISDISFLQNLTALQTLWAGNDQVVDLTPLAALTQLRQLYLEGAQISDISALTSLVNLSELRLNGNPLGAQAYCTDLPIILANNPGLALTVDPNPYNCQPEGHILFEYFWGTDYTLGSLLALPIFPDSPSQRELRLSFEGPTYWRYYYGTRARGYLHPPATGDYTFWIASDDQSQLWLSADENPANAVQIASVQGWTPPRDFDNTGGGVGGPEQRSSPVPLEAGKRYYIEALCAQGTGGDNLAVAWQGPSIPTRQVISGTFLSAWTGDSDGVPGPVEDGAPNGGDGNADGTPDSQQNNMASLPNAVDGQYVTLVSPEGTAVQNTTASGNPSPGDAPAGVEFPVGFFDFALAGIGAGDGATVTIILPPGATVETYYKYGPTPDNPSPHWYEFLYDGTTGAEILSGQVILHLVDGARGDDDVSANGLITEPGGPSVLANRPPAATIAASSSGLVVPVGSPVALTGRIYDPDPGDAHTARWTLSAAQVAEPLVINGTVMGNAIADTIVLTEPGIYSIVLTVMDAAGASGTARMVGEDLPAYVVVYDPEGGFATGGGWIWSPQGAYLANPELEPAVGYDRHPGAAGLTRGPFFFMVPILLPHASCV